MPSVHRPPSLAGAASHSVRAQPGDGHPACASQVSPRSAAPWPVSLCSQVRAHGFSASSPALAPLTQGKSHSPAMVSGPPALAPVGSLTSPLLCPPPREPSVYPPPSPRRAWSARGSLRPGLCICLSLPEATCPGAAFPSGPPVPPGPSVSLVPLPTAQQLGVREEQVCVQGTLSASSVPRTGACVGGSGFSPLTQFCETLSDPEPPDTQEHVA